MVDFSPTPFPKNLDSVSRDWLCARLMAIEAHTGKDVLMVHGDIDNSIAIRVRLALEHLTNHRKTLLVILDTPGGSVESVKTVVNTLRHFYDTVHFLVPVQAMSAGTVMVMSGDVIQMDYFSRLGPIDPQIIRNGKYVPALSYLRQYEEIQKKAAAQELTNADIIMIQTLDLAELDQIQLAAQLSISLITDWLSRYKFKDWTKNGVLVSDKTKHARAQRIAKQLNDQNKWLVHGHGIHKDILEKDLRLKIDDYTKDAKLKSLVWEYFWPMAEFAGSQELLSFIHSRDFI